MSEAEAYLPVARRLPEQDARETRLPLGQTLVVSGLVGLVVGASLLAAGVGVFWSVVVGWLVLNAAPLLIGIVLIALER